MELLKQKILLKFILLSKNKQGTSHMVLVTWYFGKAAELGPCRVGQLKCKFKRFFLK